MTSGCATTVSIEQEPIRIFNRDYYAVKDLTPSDVWKLKEFTVSDDKGAAKTAGLILGRHYVRNGQTEKGYGMIKDNLDDSYLDKFMKVSGHLWAFDAAKKSGDTERMDKEKDFLVKTDMDDKAEKAFRVYCGQEKINVTGSDLKVCITGAKSSEPFELPPAKAETAKGTAVKPEKTDAKTAMAEKTPEFSHPALPEAKPEIKNDFSIPPTAVTQEPLKKKISIQILDSVKNPELVEALLYTVSRLKINAEMDFQGDKLNYDYVIDAGLRTVKSGDTVIDFSVDRKKQIRSAADYIIKSGAKNIGIGYAEGLRDTAAEIADEYRGRAQFYLFSIQDRDFQNRLKEIKNSTKDGGISYVLAGTQDQALKVIPFLKYYAEKPEKTMITASVDSLSKKFISGEYTEYTKDALIITDIMLAENPPAEKFTGDFQKDFNKNPALSDMIGYDMLVYMEKNRNPAYSVDYLTGISQIKDGEVVRKTGAYRVSGGKLKKVEN